LIFDKLKEELLQSLRRYFPAAKVDIKERRSVILELRAYIDKESFILISQMIISHVRNRR
jgi:hypothetical protein